MSDVPSMIHSCKHSRSPTTKEIHREERSQMEATSNSPLLTATPTATLNDSWISPRDKYVSHNWEFLVGVLVTALSVSIVIALLAKAQVFRRYLASYRHTRLRETDGVGQCEPPEGLEVGYTMHGGRGINPHRMRPVNEEDDDGFIEDNYIPASVRARAARAAANMEDIEDEMDEIEFTIA